MLLYKFGKWPEWSKNTLENKTLRFSEPGALNDPLDCQIDVVGEYTQAIERIIATTDEKDAANLKLLLNGELHFRLEQNDKISVSFSLTEWVARQMLKTGVLSFSQTATDALLWAHYADGHKGVCLEFESAELGERFSRLDCGEVQYIAEPPFQSMMETTVSDYRRYGSLTGFLHTLHDRARRYIKIGVTSKSTDWKYEKEFRYLCSGTYDNPFETVALKSVILGVRIDNKRKEEVQQVLANPEYAHVKLKQAVQKPSSFHVEIVC